MSTSGEHLGEYLATRRWSGAHGEHVADARVAADVPLGDGACCVVDATVGGERVRYQLWRPIDGDATDDALEHATLRGEIVRLIADGGRVEGRGASLVGVPEPHGADALRGLTESAVGRAEQSNTSIVFDGRVMLKLFRRLAAGEQPDVEVTRFLSRHAFPHTPPLLGTLVLTDADGDTVAGMAQRFVAGARDVWSHSVELARDASHHGARVDEGAHEAARLGAVTRALHDALACDDADPAFAPRTATAADVARWAEAAERSVEQGLALLAERGGADATRVDRRAVLDTIRHSATAARDDAGAATRHHGDYHLGQVLRAADGALFVIDFEGEPSKPLEERRARHCALRDVAGMLRSFAYAAAVARLERPDDATVAARAEAWERAARTAFLDAYFAGDAARYLPRERAHADALLTLFELEKLFYELAYELRNRPTWTAIPLAGVARLTASLSDPVL